MPKAKSYEAKLQQDANKYLRDRDIQFFHFQRGRYEKNKIQRGGLPDLIIWPGSGITLFIELKTPGNKLKQDQEEFFIKMNGKGYKCYTVSNFHDFKIVCGLYGVKE